ncbi:single-stranded DNA-binding protein [Candidatus Phytoplasma solani]|uniref:Single-stranded DNA-binding protein n=5 Tax=16SrXII (Stolbur group) TaxID=85632 RepID=A0A421NY22_9MOLU|nr:single-stranded DNA-binding protein [Candidatus Phytoplasma solani]AIY62691.1 single-stranded DNA-binding protein ['Hyalesthes obsoletus' stolbur phytoplasma]AIY62692.1 single-stranded DNA-binding protein ['Vitis vinifera' stolbur phytoplasma]AIY62694.1 single-stranded DNA-binding protein ['Convolvulus arvensis' stolbur phytoplasma]AIY62699.1 single-stranded DNA-binding protein ['Catharanthus roseus' stolbur phytoplasma]AIY62693.1 single-stranded DNA-binding protein ['Vitis vinifera' stolbu
MINKVILVGRITKDPELKSYHGDNNYVKFTLAVNRSFSSQDENKKTDFINCVVWRKQAENLSRYISKGSLLGVEGSVRVEKWEKDGKTNWSTEISCTNIHFLESKKSTSSEYDETSSHNQFHQEETLDNSPF